MTKNLNTVLLVFVAIFSGVASASAVTNGSFESQNLSESYVGFLYSDAGLNQFLGYGPVGVSAPGWSFSGQSGLSYSNTLWGGTAQDGNVFGFLRNEGGEISQSFTDVAGDYAFSFNLAQRTSWRVGGFQTLSVLLDGASIWSGMPGDTWSTYSFSASNVAAGNHTLSLRGTNLGAASDTSVFVDNVRLTVFAVPEPESYTLLLVGLALIGAVARRRKVNDAESVI